jgi:hypothetical protein
MMMMAMIPTNAFTDRLMVVTTEYSSASWTDES